MPSAARAMASAGFGWAAIATIPVDRPIVHEYQRRVSITNADGSKIELPRGFPFHDALREFTADDSDRLKWLACLHLNAHG